MEIQTRDATKRGRLMIGRGRRPLQCPKTGNARNIRAEFVPPVDGKGTDAPNGGGGCGGRCSSHSGARGRTNDMVKHFSGVPSRASSPPPIASKMDKYFSSTYGRVSTSHLSLSFRRVSPSTCLRWLITQFEGWDAMLSSYAYRVMIGLGRRSKRMGLGPDEDKDKEGREREHVTSWKLN